MPHFFTGSNYSSAIVGATLDGRVVYSYDEMVSWLMKEEGMTELDAVEWIEFKVIRSIPYMGEKAPVILQTLF